VLTESSCTNGDLVPSVKSDSAGCAVAWPHGRTDLEQIANARLIAQAPELLSCSREAELALISLLMDAADPALTMEQAKAMALAHPLVVHLRRVIARASGGGQQ
jgi:hypothetical protein